MYLSRLILNPRHATVLRAISDVYAMHQLLWRAFPDLPEQANGDVQGCHPLLYRVEAASRDGFVRILAQSKTEPDWNALCTIPNLLCQSDKKEYTPEFEAGQWLRYRIRANPIVNRRSEEGKRGERQGLLTEKDQANWWQKQGERWGFSLPSWEDIDGKLHADIRIVSPGIVQGTKVKRDEVGNLHDKHVIRLLCVDYEGRLQVEDPSQLAAAVCQGIGPAKGLGFGLLSVARA